MTGKIKGRQLTVTDCSQTAEIFSGWLGQGIGLTSMPKKGYFVIQEAQLMLTNPHGAFIAEMAVRGHSRSWKVALFDSLTMVSY